jgi:hypothetical protein
LVIELAFTAMFNAIPDALNPATIPWLLEPAAEVHSPAVSNAATPALLLFAGPYLSNPSRKSSATYVSCATNVQ